MLTLLGALLGFLGSAFPELLKLFYHKQDCTHELAIMDRQIQLSKLDHSQRLEEIKLETTAVEQIALYKHARHTGVPWVDGLAGSVRPVISYAFFLLYALVGKTDPSRQGDDEGTYAAGGRVRSVYSAYLAYLEVEFLSPRY